MLRVNGFLDLDHYFKKIMDKNDYEFCDLAYEGYIIESLYAKGHYWLNIENEFYYFKNTNDIYEELIVGECAKTLGIDALSYDLAIFKGVEGVISKSYQKEDAEYISGEDLLYDYLIDDKNIAYLESMGYDREKLKEYFLRLDLSDSINTLEVIWQAIEQHYKDKKISINVSEIMKKFASIFCFNVLIAQTDATPLNWELEESKDGVKLCPLNDKDMYPRPLMSMSVNFNDKNKNNYYKLEEFFKVSSNDFIEMFLEMFDKLDTYQFIDIMNKVEIKIERKMPAFTRRRILASFIENRDSIESVINKYKRGRI